MREGQALGASHAVPRQPKDKPADDAEALVTDPCHGDRSPSWAQNAAGGCHGTHNRHSLERWQRDAKQSQKRRKVEELCRRVKIGGAPDEFLPRWPQAVVADHHIHVQRERCVGDKKAPGYEPVTESP